MSEVETRIASVRKRYEAMGGFTAFNGTDAEFDDLLSVVRQMHDLRNVDSYSAFQINDIWTELLPSVRWNLRHVFGRESRKTWWQRSLEKLQRWRAYGTSELRDIVFPQLTLRQVRYRMLNLESACFGGGEISLEKQDQYLSKLLRSARKKKRLQAAI